MSSNISFAQNLQSETGQRAIMFRLEGEIRVLEILKKFLTVQIRVEKTYSSSLGNATTAAMKTLASVLSGDSGEGGHHCEAAFGGESIVSKACLHVLEEVQTTAATLKENSDFLHANTMKQLSELIAEKKLLFRMSHEEYQKIKGKLDQFTELVNKHKGDYLKNFQAYESTRTKYEDHCAKGAKVNIKKSEDCRDKFFRTKRRLNLIHADYLLALEEAADYDRDFRTILLPGLLQIEQTWCEKQMGRWSEVLDQILNNSSSLTTSVHLKLKEFEFSKEYMELISKHKCQPLQPSNFKFEPAQISSQPVTQPVIVIDSSTIEFLRGRLNEVEKRLKLMETQLLDRNSQYVKLKGTMLGDLKSLEVSETRCEVERLKRLKNAIETYFKGLDTSSPMNQLDETISLISEQSMKKGATHRFTTFLRTAAAKTKKVVSFDEDPVTTASNGSNLNVNAANTDSNSQLLSGSSTMDRNMTSLLEQDWFHGVLPREDVVRLLRLEGDYLVRETMKNDERQLVLSVQWNGPKHFIIQTTPDGQFRFEGPIFGTVKELLNHYVRTKLPVTSRSGAVIKKSVKRETWELNNDDVQLIEKIGKGNFGDVYKASINGSIVAVKTCKVNLPDEQKRKFLQEGRILKQYDHPNIVRFVGICVQKQPIMIVMELVTGGSLLTYLKNRGKSLGTKELTKMCLNTAAGMKYLEEKSCIHRDLAARNCLIDENVFVKISDFGMSREEHEYTVSDGMKQIPIKWTAPEALNYGKYTSLSDVWSYGILMWEIFSQGATPYAGLTNSKAREMIEAGYRMPAPDGMPDVIYQLMARCWQYESEQRPRFSEIYSELELTARSDLI